MTKQNRQSNMTVDSASLAERLHAALGAARRLHDRGGDATVAEDVSLVVVDRLAAAVVRPLHAAVDQLSAPADDLIMRRASTGTPAADPGRGGWGEELWKLTVEVTELAAETDTPVLVREAAAALQDLVAVLSGTDGPDGWAARSGALRDLLAGEQLSIRASTNGPYLVSGAAAMSDWLGQPVAVRPIMALCRCGSSAIKPLCDGSHVATGFTSAKDSRRVADRRDTYIGQQVTILDNRGTCQHSGYCTDRLATAFRLGEEPFVSPSGGRMDEIIRAVRDCPSGALSYAMDGEEARDQVDFHNQRDAAIEVSKDGPYRVTGAIRLIDADGHPQSRNDGASLEHYALCRCGQSRNKPFCSGMHWYVDFHDPVSDPGSTPTVFEWAGGLPALTRMTRLFYEKYVPQDPLLATVFADMSADHPERVAKWLGEVFGGPKAYSEAYGGYTRMISQHIGKGITEDQRARWVGLLIQSAHDAGLPNDPEFRSVFGAYIEWGTRLAVENSQPGAHPPEHMPMPRWDWHAAAGPPGSRVSSLATQSSDDDAALILPADDEPVRYEKHIRQLFRSRDRQSMSFAFDLWAYADVKTHAAAILERLANGTMPCDGPWPPDRIAVFQRWIDTNMAT